jgi:hypothetical protein
VRTPLGGSHRLGDPQPLCSGIDQLGQGAADVGPCRRCKRRGKYGQRRDQKDP